MIETSVTKDLIWSFIFAINNFWMNKARADVLSNKNLFFGIFKNFLICYAFVDVT